ncbi:hypothetical protein PARPLA_02067 [Rhodobacteraceae bacterium THAF1]|uniref:BrnA antitoxin family protein n=1 Tax=Palleronia sp. THAF1 TaxID=2587842 RepID=UPI000F3FFBEF|nr:BrnA antitoxin family protein [Palleronia sp. THAF1]QFU07780.1 hypothetical protein FIU81_03735 [Palleronia sp. THAF1]VDC25595.1 hypothetical protein PARPLA_02067 [Rhodobacteraceae bacterium THAF1]
MDKDHEWRAIRAEIGGIHPPDAWARIPTYRKPAKTRLTIRVDQDVVHYFKGSGHGWHTRMNTVLRYFMMTRTGIPIPKRSMMQRMTLEKEIEKLLRKKGMGNAEALSREILTIVDGE